MVTVDLKSRRGGKRFFTVHHQPYKRNVVISVSRAEKQQSAYVMGVIELPFVGKARLEVSRGVAAVRFGKIHIVRTLIPRL